MTNVEVIGVKEVIKELRQLDPELRKQFNRDARQVAQPIIDEAKSRYPDRYLSGMSRLWSRKSRQLFPYKQRDAQRGVVFKIDTGRRAVSVLTIIQKNPAAAIIDMAGKAGGQPPEKSYLPSDHGAKFTRALTLFFGIPSRVMWPAAESQEGRVQDAMIEVINKAANTVELRITQIK